MDATLNTTIGIKLLGHLIVPQGIKADPAKYETIKYYPLAKNVHKVRRFVIFCNYYTNS